VTVAEFRRAVARAVAAADPRAAAEEHADAAARRRVALYPAPAGMATVVADLPAADARTVWLALDAIARAAKPAGAAADPGVDARRADALTALCASALADPALPRQHRRPAAVQLVVDLPTLLGLAQHPAELVGYGPLPASAARAMAADATWQRLVVEPVTGHLLDAGTTRYRPSQQLTDYILTRSRTCAFPACATPAPSCDIDHATPFDPAPHRGGARGGTTSAGNLAPACRRHHRLKTHGGWTVTAHPDGSTTWTNPHGRDYHSPPTDHRPGVW
jgi:hypothetical protein